MQIEEEIKFLGEWKDVLFVIRKYMWNEQQTQQSDFFMNVFAIIDII
jgi:hypothetical protein